MIKKLLLFLLIVISSLNSYAQTQMLIGKKHLVFATIPKNWLKGSNDQIPFFIKPQQKDVSEMTYMYVYGLDYESLPDLDYWIEGNNAGLKNELPEIQIQSLDFKFDNLRQDNFLTGKYKIIVYLYPNGRKEALLVIESKTSIFTAVLSAKDSTEFNTYLDSFKELVNSLDIKSARMKQE